MSRRPVAARPAALKYPEFALQPWYGPLPRYEARRALEVFLSPLTGRDLRAGGVQRADDLVSADGSSPSDLDGERRRYVRGGAGRSIRLRSVSTVWCRGSIRIAG
jgi:hypothetical protein